jgi:Ca2+-binding RTX toxin-like protein
MRPALRRFVLSAAALVLIPALESPVGATFAPCDYDGVNRVTVIIDPAVTKATIYVDTGDEIKLKTDATVHDCGAATTGNTSQILVNGSPANDIFQIDQDGPGGNFPHNGKLWGINLGTGSDNDLVRILGRPGVDRVYVNKLVNNTGSHDVIDTNGDGNPNIDLLGVERVSLTSFGGNDHLGVGGSGYAGPAALGSFQLKPARLPLILQSGPGSDELRGGTKNDKLIGGGGHDDAKGGAGNDLLKGGSGNDDLDGDAGTDTCKGGPGSDTTVQCEKGSS